MGETNKMKPIQVEIENVFTISNRGKFVAIRFIEHDQNFSFNKKLFLNGLELTSVFDMPRALDKNGNQRLDLFIIQLKNPEDGDKLVPDTIAELTWL